MLKADGYETTAHVSQRGIDVLKHNPHVDKIIEYEHDSVPWDKLDEYWSDLSKGYDKFINLSGSLEDGLTVSDLDVDRITWSKEKRTKELNVNYYDRTLEIGGYGHIKGKNGELYFSKLEHQLARQYRKKYKDKFLILWALSGSSIHKSYPYAHFVAIKFLKEHPDAMTLTVGEEICKILEWEHPRAKCYSGVWNIRKSLIMTQYANVVIGPDTGILHAAGCFPTPKIILLSSTSEENVPKYWENCIALSANVSCQPCFILHFELGSCLLDDKLGIPICMSKLKGMDVYDSLEKVYQEWKQK